jgi:hypothetical protein
MRPLAVCLAGACLIACVHAPRLVPAADATVDPQHPSLALANSGDVQLVVQPGDWRGLPSNLPFYVTPIDVTIVNHSPRKVRVALKDFALQTSSGFQSMPLPPFSIQMQGAAGVVRPEFLGSGFQVAPSYSPAYPGYPPWTGSFDVDPTYYGSFSGWSPPLPSPDMLSKAMPEGVLNPGGKVRGYVYFQRLPDRPARFDLRTTLVDADTGVPFGATAVPLQVSP